MRGRAVDGSDRRIFRPDSPLKVGVSAVVHLSDNAVLKPAHPPRLICCGSTSGLRFGGHTWLCADDRFDQGKLDFGRSEPLEGLHRSAEYVDIEGGWPGTKEQFKRK